jgi:hypothetical protein
MIHSRALSRPFFLSILLSLTFALSLRAQTYKIVDTGQTIYYDNQNEIAAPAAGAPFFGQDAGIMGHQASYTDNGDGTVTDNVTGLIWQQSTDLNGDGVINIEDKRSHAEALAGADTFSLAGYDDWRLPSIKEAYSLFMFTGQDPSGYQGTDTENLIPFVDTSYFDVAYGDTDAGERIIDGQYASSTVYVSTTMNGDSTMFGVNFVDGRIKGYPMGPMPGQSEDKQFYVLYVRGNELYGQNDFADNGDGTVSDLATGLMWQKNDSEFGMNWEEALAWAQTKNSESYLGYNDWRVPNAKELHSILDYSRSPATSNSAAIDPVFSCTLIQDEGDEENYPFYWTSSTHANMQNGAWAAYLCFGEGLGFMAEPFPPFNVSLLDVHGAGAQRSDPKTGSADDYPEGHGPQGDVVRIDNFVRLVRDIEITTGLGDASQSEIIPEFGKLDQNFPNPFNPSTTITYHILEKGPVSLVIRDITGKEVYRFQNDLMDPGDHQFIWTGANHEGEQVSTGIYLVTLQAGSSAESIKMAYLR